MGVDASVFGISRGKRLNHLQFTQLAAAPQTFIFFSDEALGFFAF